MKAKYEQRCLLREHSYRPLPRFLFPTKDHQISMVEGVQRGQMMVAAESSDPPIV